MNPYSQTFNAASGKIGNKLTTADFMRVTNRLRELARDKKLFVPATPDEVAESIPMIARKLVSGEMWDQGFIL